MGQLLPYYSFDSGVFINGRRDIFIPTAFPGVWKRTEEMIAMGQVRAVDEVKREVSRHDDETAKWAKAQKGLFVPLTRDVQEATSKILEQHPRAAAVAATVPMLTVPEPFPPPGRVGTCEHIYVRGLEFKRR